MRTRLFLYLEGSEILLKGIIVGRGFRSILEEIIILSQFDFFYLFGIFDVGDCTYNLFELKEKIHR